MKRHLSLLLASALLLLAVQACRRAEPDFTSTGGSTIMSSSPDVGQPLEVRLSDLSQHAHWHPRVVHREDDPGIALRLADADGTPLPWGRYETVSSRWARFIFSKRQAGILTIEEDTSHSIELSWENIGRNASGRILSYAFSPPDSAGGRTLWAGSASGGLWKFPDGGEHWLPVTDHFPAMVVSAVAVHPRHPDTLLLATRSDFGMGHRTKRLDGLKKRYDYPLFRSFNGGKTWHIYPSDTTFTKEKMDCNQLVWDPVHPDTVYLAASNGVWQSTDTGRQWQRVLEGNAKSIVLNKRSPDTLYAALYEADTTAGLWQSTNAGAKWHRLTEAPFDADSLSPTCGICMHLSLSEAFPEVVYFSAELRRGDSLYKSSDGGAHWKQVETTVQAEAGEAEAIGFWKAHVSPVDTNVIFVGGVMMYRTQDGGTSWKEVGLLKGKDPLYLGDIPQARHVHVDHHDFAFDPDRPDSVMYAFTDGGVFVSTDGGNLWTVRNTGLATLQIYSLSAALADTGRVVAGVQDQGQILLGADRHWHKVVTGDGMVALFHPYNEALLYTTSQYGNHWQIVVMPWRPDPNISGSASPPPIVWALKRMQDGIMGSQGDGTGLVPGTRKTDLWVTPKVMNPDKPHILYTATLDSVYTTTDVYGALSWRALVGIDSVSKLAVDLVNPKIVYAYSETKPRPVLWRSLDGGEKWDALAYDSVAAWPYRKVTDLEADPDRAGMLYAVRAGYKNQVWRSTDSARTWVNITQNLHQIGGTIPVNTITITPVSTMARKQIYIGTDVGVFMAYADEDPIAWRYIRGRLPTVIISDSHFHPGDSTLRVATYGRGYWKAKILP